MVAKRRIKNRGVLSTMFRPVWVMSGAVGWFGEGYWFHRWIKRFFPKSSDWSGATEVEKTSTCDARVGNLPLKKDFTPQEKFPQCILCGPWQWLWGVVLNAVSLSGPGVDALLGTLNWQFKTKPIMISFMSVAGSMEERVEEFRRFALKIKSASTLFCAKFAIQINLSCPNVGLNKRSGMTEEARMMLEVLREIALDVPVVFKLSVTTNVTDGVEIAKLEGCSGLCVSNTVPFFWNGIPRWKWFLYFPSMLFHRGEKKSPLLRRNLNFPGGGGFSGPDLLSKVEEWVIEFRKIDDETYISAGGGVQKPKDAIRLLNAGADSISIGSVFILRWWRIRRIINTVNEYFGISLN